jgi:hypothetical protein
LVRGKAPGRGPLAGLPIGKIHLRVELALRFAQAAQGLGRDLQVGSQHVLGYPVGHVGLVPQQGLVAGRRILAEVGLSQVELGQQALLDEARQQVCEIRQLLLQHRQPSFAQDEHPRGRDGLNTFVGRQLRLEAGQHGAKLMFGHEEVREGGAPQRLGHQPQDALLHKIPFLADRPRDEQRLAHRYRAGLPRLY